MGTGMLGFGRPLGLGIGIGGLGDVPEKYCAAVTGIGIHGIAGGGGIPGITQLGTLGRSISLSTFAAGGRNEFGVRLLRSGLGRAASDESSLEMPPRVMPASLRPLPARSWLSLRPTLLALGSSLHAPLLKNNAPW